MDNNHDAIILQFRKTIEHKQHLAIALSRKSGCEPARKTLLMFSLHSRSFCFPVIAKGRIRDAIVKRIAREFVARKSVAKLHVRLIVSPDEGVGLGDAVGERVELLAKRSHAGVLVHLV